MRRRARVDGNHRMLLNLAKQLGGYVQDTSQVGSGCPDAFVFTRDKGWTAIEVKDAKAGKLTPYQAIVHEAVPCVIWRTEADVLAHFGIEDSGRLR